MKHILDAGFKIIARQILREGRSLEEWAEIESDDMFQYGDYEGGFDATEREFYFSVYLEDKEFWFQLSLEDMKQIESGELVEIEIELNQSKPT